MQLQMYVHTQKKDVSAMHTRNTLMYWHILHIQIQYVSDAYTTCHACIFCRSLHLIHWKKMITIGVNLLSQVTCKFGSRFDPPIFFFPASKLFGTKGTAWPALLSLLGLFLVSWLFRMVSEDCPSEVVEKMSFVLFPILFLVGKIDR